MTELSALHHTFVLERAYPASPDKVYAALSEPAKKRVWFAEGGEHHQLEEFSMDFRVGGAEVVSSRFGDNSPFPGVPLVSNAIYLDIVPGRRIVMAGTMSVGDKRISATLGTFEVVAAADGTVLVLTHQAAFFEGADGPQLREEGWRKLLERLGSELAR